MSSCFGLYFGNTNLCLAVCKEDKAEVLANAAGDRVTPAFVAFSNGEKLLGLPAKQGMVRNASNTITNMKSLIEGDSTAISKCKCKVIEEDGFHYQVEIDGKLSSYSPKKALVSLFKVMNLIARSHCDESDVSVVVTVPFRFEASHKEVVTDAASEAGFTVLRVISEPAAALLATNVGQDSPNSTVNSLVFRMGGTSIDVTVVQVTNGMYHILGSANRKDFGGNVFTSRLVDFCAGEFKRQYRTDITENKRSVMKLNNAAEICKHVLSSVGTAQCFSDSIYDGIDLSINVSKARFDSLISNQLQQCLEPVREALDEAGLSATDIKKLVLAGGSCKIPKLQQLLSDMFPESELLDDVSPDEVIAIGAAKQAVLVKETMLTDDICYIDVLSHEIYAIFKQVDNDQNVNLFLKNIPIPAAYSESFVFAMPVSHVEIHEKGAGNSDKLLAKIKIMNATQLALTAQISKDGILNISCTDLEKNVKKSLVVMPKSD